MSRPRLLLAEGDRFDEGTTRLLEAHLDVVSRSTTQGDLSSAIRDFDAVWIRLGLVVDAAVLGDAPRCRVIACPATGLDHVDVQRCAALGITVVSLKGEVEFLRDVRATAELTVALMLGAMRRLPAASRSVQGGTWDRDLFQGNELSRKTVGIVGVGRLGTLVARMLRGFDCTLVGYDPRTDFPVDVCERSPTLGALLARADVVTLHVSYDAATRHLFGPETFAAMKRGAWLVNTSRGGVVDEAALLHALESRHLSGAALDVVEGEPTPDLAGPLFARARSHDDLVIVPHVGGNTVESRQKTNAFVAVKVLEALGVEAAR